MERIVPGSLVEYCDVDVSPNKLAAIFWVRFPDGSTAEFTCSADVWDGMLEADVPVPVLHTQARAIIAVWSTREDHRRASALATDSQNREVLAATATTRREEAEEQLSEARVEESASCQIVCNAQTMEGLLWAEERLLVAQASATVAERDLYRAQQVEKWAKGELSDVFLFALLEYDRQRTFESATEAYQRLAFDVQQFVSRNALSNEERRHEAGPSGEPSEPDGPSRRRPREKAEGYEPPSQRRRSNGEEAPRTSRRRGQNTARTSSLRNTSERRKRSSYVVGVDRKYSLRNTRSRKARGSIGKSH